MKGPKLATLTLTGILAGCSSPEKATAPQPTEPVASSTAVEVDPIDEIDPNTELPRWFALANGTANDIRCLVDGQIGGPNELQPIPAHWRELDKDGQPERCTPQEAEELINRLRTKAREAAAAGSIE